MLTTTQTSLELEAASSTATPSSPWSGWTEHFERNRRRPLPPTSGVEAIPRHQQRALAWSLARFQLGETGEGRIAHAITRCRIRAVDDHYRHALRLFIQEEGRHARVLALILRSLGGRLLRTSWTDRWFVAARGLLGIRFKLLVMFAAEVIGIGFYSVLAAHLPPCEIRVALEQIASDEQAHLKFHRQFFEHEAPHGWRRGLFLLAWAGVAHAAAAVVLWDHRHALRVLGVDRRQLARSLRALIREGTR